MFLFVDNFRLGIIYILSVVGYNEVGEGKILWFIFLIIKSISKFKCYNGILRWCVLCFIFYNMIRNGCKDCFN